MTPNAAGPDAAEVIIHRVLNQVRDSNRWCNDEIATLILTALVTNGFTVMRQDAVDTLRTENAVLAEKLVAAVEREKVLTRALADSAQELAHAGSVTSGLMQKRFCAAKDMARAALPHTAPSERPDGDAA